MTAWLRPVVVFGVTGVAGLAVFASSGGAHGSDTERAEAASFAAGVAYAGLGDLELLESTLYYVEESYVDPGRVDYEAMYVAALHAVEVRIPVTMFRREPGGTLLHVEVGSFRTVLDVQKVGSRKELQRELQRVADLLSKNLVASDIPMRDGDVGDPFAQVEYAMVNGALGTLDPHSRLLPPEASREMDVDNLGEFGGLGITIIERKGRLTVEYPLPDTPASREDIRADDQIVRIDGVSTINMSLDEAVSRLRGVIGTPVTIEIMRDGATEPITKTITRARIELKPVEGIVMDGNIGYVSVKGFHAQIAEQLAEVLARLERESGGLKGLIIDLRDNPGGYLTQAEKMADLFLERGTIVSQVDSDGRKIDEFEARASGNEPKYPIAVLVNASSASASEIVSGALRNNERAVIIGERTYGKGSVQNLHKFIDESQLKLTISKYLTPGDKSIQAVGIPADIELVPTMVERKSQDDGSVDDIALLYFRERARREADADKHLEQASIRLEEPSYSLRYWRPVELKRRSRAEIDLSDDFEAQFARDVLLASTSPRRADVLAAAAPVVAKYEKQATATITEKFSLLGLDWADGPSAKKADLDVKFDLGADGVLVAGQEERVALEVTNRGSTPIYRMSAIATFEGDYGPREFFFGKLMPGETRRYEQPVTFVAGHPTELAPVNFSFREGSGAEIAHREARLPVQGAELPRLTWQVQVSDAAPGGDGDGSAEVGEKLRLDFAVRNDGKGTSREAFARVKNLSGRALDITSGTVEAGAFRDKSGVECVPTEPGVDSGHVYGDPNSASVKSGALPKWPAGCAHELRPGESWSGAFEVLVREPPKGDHVDLKLEIGDASAYDHAAIVRSEFWSYFVNEQSFEIPVGKPAPKLPAGVPPVIDVTQAPEVSVQSGRASISGVVTDDQGIAHVEIWHAGEKVFYQGSVRGTAVRSVPFTADVALTPGLNTIAVLATDENGFTDTASVVTFYVTPEDAKGGEAVSMGVAPRLTRTR